MREAKGERIQRRKGRKDLGSDRTQRAHRLRLGLQCTNAKGAVTWLGQDAKDAET